MLNPYIALAVILALAASHGAVAFRAYQAGQDNVTAEQAKIEKIIEETRDVAINGAAEAIAKIEVRNVTIRQKAETITREVPVYRDCRHDADGLRLVNDALSSGRPPSSSEDVLPRVDSD